MFEDLRSKALPSSGTDFTSYKKTERNDNQDILRKGKHILPVISQIDLRRRSESPVPKDVKTTLT